jgi:uncharacterized cupin superfamily protein
MRPGDAGYETLRITCVVNIYRPEFDEPREAAGFNARRARLGYQLATERLGVSLWELPPGQAAYPFHYHLAEEELLIVLNGQPTLRMTDESRELREGDVISFPRGPIGAHQLINRTSSTITFLAFSTNGEPDIVVYPDSEKIGVVERLPRGGGLRAFFRKEAAVDYLDRESAPPDG